MTVIFQPQEWPGDYLNKGYSQALINLLTPYIGQEVELDWDNNDDPFDNYPNNEELEAKWEYFHKAHTLDGDTEYSIKIESDDAMELLIHQVSWKDLQPNVKPEE